MRLKMKKIFLVLLAGLIFWSCQKNVNGPESDDLISRHSFKPPDGECLFILGQASEASMEAYMNEVRQSPAGFAFYTSLSDGAVQGDMPRYQAFLNQYLNTMLQLAIWTGERQWGDPGYYLDRVVQGQYDYNISALAHA